MLFNYHGAKLERLGGQFATPKMYYIVHYIVYMYIFVICIMYQFDQLSY